MYGRLGEVEAEVKVKQRTSNLTCTVSLNLNLSLPLTLEEGGVLRQDGKAEVKVEAKQGTSKFLHPLHEP